MALITGIIFAHQWWLLVGFIWLFGRLVTLKRPIVTAITAVATGIFAVVCMINQQAAVRQTCTHPVTGQATLRVYPDQLKVNGDQFQLLAMDPEHHQQLQVYGRIKSVEQQQQLLHLDQMTTWQVKGTLAPLAIATNVNQFNAQQYARTRRVYNQLTVDQIINIHAQPSHGMTFFRDWCHQCRYALIRYFDTMPKMLKVYCNSLLIGNVLSEFSDVMTGVTQLGLIHLFSISGMHVFLFVGLIRLVMVYAWIDREVINWVLVGVLPAYFIIGGGATGLVRATIMAEITLICGSRFFHLSKIDIWSLSLIGGLVYQPLLLMTLGGQLSYLLALMLHFLPSEKPLLGAIMMNLAGVPSILNTIYDWHVLSLFASYLMIPFFGTVIFPLVIGTALLDWLFPAVGQLADHFLTYFQALVDAVGKLPGMIHFGKPPAVVLLSLLVVTMLVYVAPDCWRWWRLLGVLYLLTFIGIHTPITGEVVFFDIGQGDSFLIREPFNRRVTMIDTGGRLSFAKPSWARTTPVTSRAKRVSVNYLKSRGISRIDNLCLSHQDADHIGDTAEILKNMRVTQISFPRGMERQRNFQQKVLPLANQQGSRLLPVIAGTKIPNLPLKVIYPFTPGKGANEDSMVLMGRFGGLQFLFMGDLDRDGERAIIQRYPQLRTDVLKLGHHGSKTASDPAFVKQVAPQMAIISAGRLNRYGHPNNETMRLLKRQHIRAVSTQQYGMINYRYGFFCQPTWHTRLKGDELKWMLPPYSNS